MYLAFFFFLGGGAQKMDNNMIKGEKNYKVYIIYAFGFTLGLSTSKVGFGLGLT